MMMKNYDGSIKINHNPNCPYIPGHVDLILIIDSSGAGKTNVLLNSIKHQRQDIDKNYLLTELSPGATELFPRGRKINILLVFISQSYFKVSKTIRLNATRYFIMKIPYKRELQQIPSNH